MKTFYTFCFLYILSVSLLLAQDGALDNTFGNGGLVTQQVGQDTLWRTSSGTAVAITSTGKIVIGGMANNVQRSDRAMVTCFNANGTFDSSFGESGVWISPVMRSECVGVHIGEGDKIYVTGTARPTNEESAIYVHRLLPDGTNDNTYGNNGYATGIDKPGIWLNALASRITDNEQIVTGGGGSKPIFARFNTDGSLDNSFNNGEILYVDAGGKAYLHDIAVQKDGKALATGHFELSSKITHTFVFRLTKEGVLDNAFANEGVFTHQFSDVNFSDVSYGQALAVQADGKILVAGFVSFLRKFLARLNPDGSLDTDFGDNGVVYIQHWNAVTSQIDLSKVLVQPDGKIIVVGTFPWDDYGDVSNFYMERFLPDGKVDKDFGVDGFISTDFGIERNDLCLAAVPQNDGKIVLIGSSEVANGHTEVSVARYNSGLDSWGSAVSVFENQQQHSVKIYPNPANKQFTVQMPHYTNGMINVKVSNLLGQTVYANELSANYGQNIVIKTDHLGKGIFLVSIKSDNNTYLGKVIVGD